MSKKVIVTGSAGFIGSHFVEHILANTDWKIVGLDSFRHRGDTARLVKNERYTVHTCDLAQPISHRIEDLHDADYFVNFASESHVDRSITEPRSFIENNVSLAISAFEFAKVFNIKKFIQISTDEVYGAAPTGVAHAEWSPIIPSNPYAASKAAQEAIAISWWRTYQLPLIIVNGMNMFGERQDPEKFIPGVIKKIANGQTVTVHGSPDYIGMRHYIHARNFSDAVLYLLREITPATHVDSITETSMPTRFNIVGEVEMNNLDLAMLVSKFMGKRMTYELVDFHRARPGHDRRYALDGTKLKNAGWKQPITFEKSLEKTVHWFLNNPVWTRA